MLVFAVKELAYKLSEIILWGFSLGSGPTIEIASRFSRYLLSQEFLALVE
jgi:hypothetical protein